MRIVSSERCVSVLIAIAYVLAFDGLDACKWEADQLKKMVQDAVLLNEHLSRKSKASLTTRSNLPFRGHQANQTAGRSLTV
jgi:hypothetical protein